MTRYHSLLVALVFIVLPLFLPAQASKRIAIFDYEYREAQKDGKKSIAHYIKHKLLEKDSLLSIELFSANSKLEQAIDTLKKLDKSGYNLIITISSDALVISHHTVKNTPLLFTNVNNPRYLGIKDLKNPGRHRSGVTYYVPMSDQLKLIREIQPNIKKIGAIFDKDSKSRLVEAREMRHEINKLGMIFSYVSVMTQEELKDKTTRLIDEYNVEAIIISSSDKLYLNTKSVTEIAYFRNIPVYSVNKKGVENGALASLSSDYYKMVDELLLPMINDVICNGIDPGNIPIEKLEKPDIYLNRHTEKELKLAIPKYILNNAIYVNEAHQRPQLSD